MNYPTIPAIDVSSSAQAARSPSNINQTGRVLGLLEDLSIQLAGMTGKARPRFHRKGVIVMAADHGIVKEGVSAYPSEVTAQMVLNFLNNGAAVNVLARQAGALVKVVDIGVDYDFHGMEGLLHRKIAYGTMNMLKGPAMTPVQTEAALQVGIELVQSEINQGLDLVAIGEMGIGNTTLLPPLRRC